MDEVKWDCVIHPVEWRHEYGCPHRLWTAEELHDGLVNWKLKGKPLYHDFYVESVLRTFKENSSDGT